MKPTRALLLAAALLALSATSPAAPVLHDTLGKFSAISAAQGRSTDATGTGLVNVDPNRSQLVNMFDNDPGTLFTLGLGGTASNGGGGTIEFLISPATNLITGATLVTTGRSVGSTLIDFTELFLGVNATGWQYLGKLGSDGSIDTTGGLAGVLLSSVVALDTTTFSLSLAGGAFNSVRLRDVTPQTGANRDGFDIAAFSVTSDMTVPTPGTLALATLGLVALGVSRRRRA
jgi:MYXO-CTERM domain-containing protein